MFTLIKKNKILVILLAIFSILFLFDKTIFNKPKTPPKTIQDIKRASYQNLTPGSSTKEQVTEILGNPLKEEADGTILKFTSSAPGKPHEVVIKENNILLIKETITINDDKKVNDIKKEFGEPKKILFGPGYTSEFYLSVYPENGIAYIGQDASGVLLEVWYFTPTNINDFIINYAPNYTRTPPSHESGY